MTYITGTSATGVGTAYGLLVTINTGFASTGTITIADSRGTFAVITTPAVGSAFRYYGLQGAITVTLSATADVTVSLLNRQGA